MGTDASAWLEGTLEGDRAAAGAFVAALRPVVQARVARILLRYQARARGRDLRQEVDDLTQEVFARLFADDARVIRRWRPDGGLSLANFVGLITERLATQVVTRTKRGLWTEDPTLDPGVAVPPPSESDLERRIVHRDLLQAVLMRLRAELSARAMQLFELLLVERRPIPEIIAETGLSRDALYQWRSRLARRVREIAHALSSDAGSRPQDPR